MFFLLRLAFWFALVLFMLPLGASQLRNDDAVSPLQAISAARQAIQDVAGMCEREPDVCTTGKAALRTIGSRASDTARTFSDTLDRTLEEDAAPAAPIPTPRPQRPVGASD